MGASFPDEKHFEVSIVKRPEVMAALAARRLWLGALQAAAVAADSRPRLSPCSGALGHALPGTLSEVFVRTEFGSTKHIPKKKAELRDLPARRFALLRRLGPAGRRAGAGLFF